MIQIGNRTIVIKKGDITEESTDVIVNPANSLLRHGGGVAGAITRKGGAEIQEQSNKIVSKIGQVPVGKAVITDAGNLSCKFVIHTVGPQWGEGDETTKLKKAIMSVLTMAELYNLKSISIPAVSSGIFGFPKTECAKILLEAAVDFFSQDDVNLEKITMCNCDEKTYQIFLEEEKLIISRGKGGCF